MNVQDRIFDMEVSLQRLLKQMKGLNEFGVKVGSVGGSLPRRIQADLVVIGEVEAAEIDDDRFAEKLAEIAGEGCPISGMMNLATLAARLKAAGDRIAERAKKLSDREAAQCGDSEGSNAAKLKMKLNEAKKVLDNRLKIALDRFFERRLYVVNATLKLTETVCDLWKGGAAELRAAALKSSAAQAIASLAEWDRVAAQGALKVGSSAGKGGVKI